MHVLFYHQNYPAQFGHVAHWLVQHHGFRCTFLSEKPSDSTGPVERIQYQVKSGATRHNHLCTRSFENAIGHSVAAFDALKARPDIKPDLIVGHSGFGSTLFLRELFDCPMVNFFELFYHTTNSDMDYRPDFPPREIDKLRARARNAILLLDLENCDAGYSPTHFQRSRIPEVFHEKVEVIFDGLDTQLWCPKPNAPRRLGDRDIPDDVRIVTYVARGMEAIRGFDIFMKLAKRLCQQRSDVIFAVVGEDRICYGNDARVTGSESFREWVLAQDYYDLERILFLGRMPPSQLAELFTITDLHVYLTAPFVLSWSLMNALACGATVMGSSTPPVMEMIEHQKNGLLVDFFDVDAMVETANEVLNNPQEYRPLGQAGMEMIREKYSMEVCLPKMLQLYQRAGSGAS